MRIFLLSVIIQAVLLCTANTVVAQHPFYYNINDDNGLPSNEVYDLHQDSFGYMWIGCDAGLFRYDGFKFQRYKNSKQNAVAISGLILAKNDKVFCQNFFGQLFYAQQDSLVLFADIKEQIMSHPEYTVDNNGNVWLGLPDGILKYNADKRSEYLFRNELSITEIESTPSGDIYALDSRLGLLKIFLNARNQYEYQKVLNYDQSFDNCRHKFERLNNRLFLLSTKNVTNAHIISEILGNEIRVINRFTKADIAEYIYTVSMIDGQIWLGTSNGAFKLSEKGQPQNHYFLNEKISRIIVDKEGSCWFSSLQNGIFVIPHLNLIQLNANNSALTDGNITALHALGNNEILAGTYKGDIYKFNTTTGALSLFPKNSDVIYRNVTSIIPYNENTVIAGRGGLSVINTKQKTESNYAAVYIRDMAMVGDSLICVSTQSISAISQIKELVEKGVYTKNTLKSASGKKVCFDRASGNIWVTLNEGLARMEGDKFTPYVINGQPVFCNALYADANGLWAGTVSDGVYNIRNGKTAFHLDARNGLMGNNIKCITSQNDTLYVATDECINIRYPDGHYAYMKHADGINAKEINAICINSPFIFIGTIRGMFYLPVQTNFANKVRPGIRITSVYSDNNKNNFTNGIKLSYTNKDILINFSATALRSRGRFNYLYRIEGFQNDWKKLEGSINNVRLNHLPAGNYNFEVKAVNEDGLESANVAGFPIEVAAPFWQHWWFYVIIVFAASSVVTLVFALRIRNIKKQADIRNQLKNSQLTALKAQMNPHFMYNTLNSIQDLVLQNDIKSTNYYLSRYSTLMRKILDTSEHDEIELAEETDILQLYLELEELRFGNDFKFSIVVDAAIDKNKVQIPSMIIQPFVENAIKHGLLHKKGKKTLQIVFRNVDGLLRCIITDNGVGRAKAKEIKERSPLQHKPFATRATEKRLELINLGRTRKVVLQIVDLTENGVALGTEVNIEIP